MEWECCIKSPEQGAREGAPFIKNHIIEATEKTFDDFAGGEIVITPEHYECLDYWIENDLTEQVELTYTTNF